MESIQVGQTKFHNHKSGIVDTGSTMIILDTQTIHAVHTHIPNAQYNDTLGLWTVPCDKVDSLPDIQFHLVSGSGNKSLTLTPRQYTVPSWQTQEYWDAPAGRCPTYLVHGGEDKGPFAFVLGQKFLEAYVSVYDGDRRRIGFAPNNVLT